MKARVFVSFKPTVLDPQGQAIRGALNGLGHGSIAEVRQGKFFDIEIAPGAVREEAAREMDQIAREAGMTNVEFRKGTIEELPLPDSAVDVVISNCVINLASNKASVFAEMARVLKPGGRVGVSDVVADDLLTPQQRAERGSYVGCIAGALSFREFRAGLNAVGMTDVEVVPTHQLVPGMHSAIVRATKPA